MAIDRAKLAGDYSLVITSLNRLKGPWCWEIRRKSKPLGIKNYDNSLKTESAARIAGERALVPIPMRSTSPWATSTLQWWWIV
jgi:hypothetical protein